jgi:hypothetical protein
MTDITKLSDGLNYMRVEAFSAAVKVKASIDTASAMKGLTALQKRFPTLSESSFDPDKQIFKLENSVKNPKDAQLQMLFTMVKGTNLVLYWGAKAPFDASQDISTFYQLIQDEFGVYPINVDYIDFNVYAVAEINMNFYAAIWEAFYAKSPLYGMFSSDRILQDDLSIRYMLHDERICLLEIESNVNYSEIRSNSFENDMLKARIGIAQTRGIAPDANLGALGKSHFDFSTDFVRENLRDRILEPLDAAISRIAG